MVKSFFNKSPDQVNIFDLLIICWKDRILITIVLILSIILGLIISFFSHKSEIQQIIFEIRYPPTAVFKSIDYNFKSISANHKIADNDSKLEFISIFEKNFNSLNNLETFIEKSENLSSFKNFLKKEKKSSKEYFMNLRIASYGVKYGQKVAHANLLSKYVFSYPAELIDGDKFLINYIEYTKTKTLDEYLFFLKSVSLKECKIIQQIFDNQSTEFFKATNISDAFVTILVENSNCKSISKNFDEFFFYVNNYNLFSW
jgi:LPS O-antigen subunit length determinant protein (WzzB/FepE family)